MTTTEKFVHKTEKLADIAREYGWSAKIVPELNTDPAKIKWVLFCVRKPEAIKVIYEGNRMVEALYVMGDKVTSPPHKGAVVKLLTGQPDMRRLDGSTALQNRSKLPFDPDDILPGRILEILMGRKITWLNSLSTELESERIEPHRNKGSRWYRIVRTEDGRRYIEFTTDRGFRAVYLDAIISAH